MTDLYDTLGVPRDATSDEITAAYRQRAKDAHPDAGGSEEQFHAIALAKRILTDEDKRARYDETGKIEDQADNEHAAAMEIVASVIQQLIDLPDAIYTDLISEAGRAIDSEANKQVSAKQKAESDLSRTVKMRARFKAKAGKIDRVGALLDSRADAIRQVMRQMDERLEMLKRAKALLADQTFEVEMRPVPPPNMTMAQASEWGRQTGAQFVPYHQPGPSGIGETASKAWNDIFGR